MTRLMVRRPEFVVVDRVGGEHVISGCHQCGAAIHGADDHVVDDSGLQRLVVADVRGRLRLLLYEEGVGCAAQGT